MATGSGNVCQRSSAAARAVDAINKTTTAIAFQRRVMFPSYGSVRGQHRLLTWLVNKRGLPTGCRPTALAAPA
ncbi:hypothetical protein, partial [Mesorhizobium sp.]|uniref:hypothetical protein n=1 Tax=Mesorhizobium sp. TaxID=1871066 RepID=UPI0025C066B8